MGLGLTVRGLVVKEPSGRDLLTVPELTVPAGQLVGIRGPSGAGKTTLLHAIAGLREAQGQVLWDGADLLSLLPEKRARFRARSIGMIFQDFLLFDELSGLGNASLPAMYAPRKTRRALRDRAAGHLAALGIVTEDAPRTVASYSGGERQRIAIARALASDAPVILADEPTASLHREAADALIDDLVALARRDGTTLIAVSHDDHLLARMHRVLTIVDGRIGEITDHA